VRGSGAVRPWLLDSTDVHARGYRIGS
jgi:hypothetical protein